MIGRDFNLFETPGASATPFAQVVNRAVTQKPQVKLSEIPNAPLIATKDWKGELATTVPGTQGSGALGGGRIADESEIEKINAFAEAIKTDNPEYSVLPPEKNKGLVEVFIQDNPEYSSVFKKQEQSFIGGFADKTSESFMSGINRIGEAGVGLAEGKYNIPEAAFRGAAGSLESFFSPISGAVGQSIESGVSDEIKQGVASKIAPVAEKVSNFRASLTPEVQREFDNLIVGLELGANFLGAGGVSKAVGSGAVKAGVKGTGKVISKGVTATGKGIAKAGEIVASPFVKNAEANLIKSVGAETADAVIDGVKVSIPRPNTGIVKKAVGVISRVNDPKVLAGKALAPSYAGKTPKQIVNTIADTEKNVKEYWKQVRTGNLQGDLTDLTTSAQSVIDNLDTVGARIGNAVKSAKGDVGVFDSETNLAIREALGSVTAKRSPATPILQNFIDDLQTGIDVKDGFALKRVYQNEIGKLIRSGDAGTDQFSALVKGVDSLTSQIDDLVEKSAGSKAFLQDKKNYALLKKLAGDIAKSAQVEARRSPMTLTEQIGNVRGILGAITNPIDTATNFLAREVGEMNTRGGAWKALIDQYDISAIKAAGDTIKPKIKPIIKPTKPIIKKTEKFLKDKKTRTLK